MNTADIDLAFDDEPAAEPAASLPAEAPEDVQPERSTRVRLNQHRDRIVHVLEELDRELSEYLVRRDTMRRKLDALDHALSQQIADVDATIKIYQTGINAIGPRQERVSEQAAP
jgi:hypothetical protein